MRLVSKAHGDAGVQRAADMADELLQQKESRVQAGVTTSTEQWVLDMEVGPGWTSLSCCC